ncbi:DUF7489 domain-containing protein [Actinomycetota bacterium Odt1-20B]
MFTSRKSGKDESWEGVVTDKSRGMTDGSNMYHYAEIRLTDGQTKKVRVGRSLWKDLAVGDRLVKEAGTDPVKG